MDIQNQDIFSTEVDYVLGMYDEFVFDPEGYSVALVADYDTGSFPLTLSPGDDVIAIFGSGYESYPL